MDENLNAKIGDLGIIAQTTNVTHTVGIGTFGYQAPELYSNEIEEYDDKVDMWALGIIAYQLFNKKIKFNEIKFPFAPF